MKRYLISLAVLLAAPPALAQKADAWLRMTSPSLNQFNASGVDADEKFFNVKGAPPNVMFLLDTSGSMRALVEPSQSWATRSKGTGCDNALYNAILDSGVFNPLAPLGTYPPPDLGITEAGVDSGFPDLFKEGDYFVNEDPTSGNDVVDGLSDSGATGMTLANACNRSSWGAAEKDACLSCMATRGYFLDPANRRDVFSGRFLNFYPPKFVVARTVIKRVVWDVKSVRMGLSTFNGDTGASLQGGLNPPCDKSFDPEDASWTNNRKSILNGINNTSKVSFSGSTPLAEALLNVGQLFTTDDSVFNNWFGSGWTNGDFKSGSVTSESRTVCFGCQVSSVVLITDGAPNGDNCIPQCIQGVGADCVGCNAGGGSCSDSKNCPNACSNSGACIGGKSDCCDGDPNNYLDDVAQWFWEHDLQTKNPSNGKWSADGRQRMATYTVGFGFNHPLLQNTANVAGGKYFYSNDTGSLSEAIYKIIDDVNTRATTFGVSSISTLQTSSGISTLVPRFIPGSKDENWKGLLYRFGVDNEQVNGCVPTPVDTPAHPLDRNGDHDCEDLFYTDRDGDVVEEDALTGLFLKANSNSLAKPVWEAGAELTYATPTYSGTETRDDGAPGRRNIYTVVDSDNDGKLTSADKLIDFTAANASQLMGAMGLGKDVTNDPTCKKLYLDIGDTTLPIDQWGEECAKVIIRHYRGWQAGSKDPTVRTHSRAWLLGDIFHSSPVTVEPPVLPESCAFFPGQCLSSLWVKDGKFDDADTQQAYRDWVSGNHCGGSASCEERRSFVLVGANDGFLHAFDSGKHTPPSDPADPARDIFSGRLPYDHGTGKELWAFVPPDLLRVMKDGLGQHTYFVDGTAMVRDIWVDQNGDRAKQKDEFRTVAIVGERGGGNHYFALDITANMGTPTAPGKPTFLWMWPQPGDPRIADVADTFSNFYPRPPPIGPVLLDDDAGFEFRYQKPTTSGSTEVVTNARERWVVALNGGPDRALQRGRGLALVDAWTGELHWDAFWKSGLDATDPRLNLRYPVGAGVGLLDIGSGEHTREAPFDGYFDAFTVGDLGGSLWVGRMHAPGVKATPADPVSNWELARAFQSRKAEGENVKNRRPISYITSNSLQRNNGYLRTFFGTGDRAAILEKGGGTCSLDNPRTCIEMGCRVEVSQWRRNLPAGETLRRTKWETGQQVAANDVTLPGCPSTACMGTAINTCTTACAAAADPATCLHTCSLGARLTCGATTGNCTDAAAETGMLTTMTISHCPTATTTASSGKLLTRMLGNWCEGSGAAARCRQEIRFNDKDFIDYQPTALAALPKHAFMGAHVYGGNAGPTFTTRAEAVAFDTARRTETNLVDLGMITAASTTTASQDSAGWRLSYETSDERTASPSGMEVSLDGESVCVVWNTLTPIGSGNICGGSGSQQARLVQADFVTGSSLCLEQFPAGQRFTARTVLVPPPEPTRVTAISASGVTSGLVLAEPGSNPEFIRGFTAHDPLQPIYQLELTPQEHQCRHDAIPAACGP